MSTLTHKTALITGAASGIGKATADLFRDLGAEVIGLDQEARPEESILGCDLLHADTLDSTIDELLSQKSHFDILINCAGGGIPGGLDDITMADFDSTLSLNLRATTHLCRRLVPKMRERGQGSIVNVGSTFGLMGRDAAVAYGVSKAGVIQLTRCLAIDLSDSGVRVNCVCPGLIETPLTSPLFNEELSELRQQNLAAHAMKRAGQPIEVARVIAFLASDLASYMTGAVVPVDGGYTAGKWLI